MSLCCNRPTCFSFRSPRNQLLDTKTCLTAVGGSQNPLFAYYSRRRDPPVPPHGAPEPLLLKPACAVKAGEEEIQLNRFLLVGKSRVAEKARRYRARRGGRIGGSALRFEISVDGEGEGEEGMDPPEESCGAAMSGDEGERKEKGSEGESGVSVASPSSIEGKKTMSPLRMRASAPPS